MNKNSIEIQCQDCGEPCDVLKPGTDDMGKIYERWQCTECDVIWQLHVRREV